MTVSATPNLPSGSASTSSGYIKIATPDLIIMDDALGTLDPSLLESLIFEQVSAHEIISIARHDTVNGQPVSYMLISNLSQIASKYGPNTMIRMPNNSSSFFNNFSIKLEDYIPSVGSGPGGLSVYIDSNNALVVELAGLENDHKIEVEVLRSGTVNNGTIY
tara:strand:+ start:9179 stop:9664 length:486 start_codon:yes stop_codon:yes gene_type:complete